ncbi:unnamed protein product [marine sediment metagenome]|uniref:Uncharacterized protein n=1 Tax=marine sediment metagenome TaxID=412755 RepID=X1KK43_9ZZZZ
MTKKEKINLLIAGLIVLTAIGGWWFYNHQKDVNICKEKCVYVENKPFVSGFGSVFDSPKEKEIQGEYVWRYRSDTNGSSRIFETQKQCIDYCLMDK